MLEPPQPLAGLVWQVKDVDYAGGTREVQLDVGIVSGGNIEKVSRTKGNKPCTKSGYMVSRITDDGTLVRGFKG